jgi:sugar phosphate permease
MHQSQPEWLMTNDCGSERAFLRALPYVALTTSIFFLTYLVRAVFGPFLPDLEREFAISHTASTRFLLFISVGYSLAVFFSCLICHKIQPRRMVVCSVIGSGLIMVGIALTKEPVPLPFLFLFLGMATGFYFNAGFSTICSLGPPSQWSRIIAVHEFAPNAGLFVAPLLAGIGAGFWGWRWTVAALGLAGISFGVLFHFLGKGGTRPGQPVSFTGFSRALRTPRLWFFIWGVGISISVHFGVYSVLTLHMLDERLLSMESAVFLLSTSRIVSPLAVLLSGRLLSRLGMRVTLGIAFGMAAATLVLMALPWFTAFVIGLYVQPVFAAIAIAAMFTLLAQSFPEETPLYVALGTPLGSFIGLGVMPVLLGLWGDHVSFTAGFLMVGCLAAMTLPFIWKMRL